jgi:chemotaxis protein methyltransferase CheR
MLMNSDLVVPRLDATCFEQPVSDVLALELDLILRVLDDHCGYSFAHYSKNSLVRSLQRAVTKMGLRHITDLIPVLLHQPERMDDVVDAITVNYTQLFREPKSWAGFTHSVLPRLYSYPSINIWIAGCSTGEELYSLLILLAENSLLSRVNITATDINARVLKTASRGRLTQRLSSQDSVAYKESGGAHQLSDYFDGADTLNTTLTRSLNSVDFKVHDLCKDEPLQNMHLIFCRNVMIYFERSMQKKVVNAFEQSLVPLGYCSFGTKERLISLDQTLQAVTRVPGWYKRLK